MTLKDKVVIVTGGTAGVGLEIVKECLSLGAKVMIHSSPNSKDKAEQLVKKFGSNTSYVVVDLSDFDKLSSIIDKTLEVFGSVDSLINNAGVFPRNNIFEMDEEFYDFVMNINYKAPLFLCKAVTKAFMDQDIEGTIVNIGSINAYCGQDDLLVYSSSKGALMTMTRNLGDFLGQYKIRVNQVNIGWTHTEKEHQVRIGEGNPENWHENIPKTLAPRGKILSPKEVAQHVVFWASAYSAPVSGSVTEVEQYPIIGRIKLI